MTTATIDLDQKTWERAKRLICAATGEDYGDGLIVTDIGTGFSEPGYQDDGPIWVTGDWNPKRFRREGEPELSNEESLAVRLGDALDKLGVELLWLDEWESCQGCYKIVRTQADSYSWTPSFYMTDDGFFCHECAEFDDIEEDVINNHRQLVATFFDLEAEGFEKFNGTYESGWHPGQDANPEELSKLAHSEGWDEVVFQHDYSGQFDMGFKMLVRNVEDDG